MISSKLRLYVLLSAMLGLLVGLPASAQQFYEASQHYVTYDGGHPIPDEYGGGWCPEDGAHSHDYEPDDYNLYTQYDGELYFIGDPTDFGFGGATYSYWDNHRIDVYRGGTEVELGYCYIPGPHVHVFAPPRKVVSYYKVYVYSGVNYYYWYDDLFVYPNYVRYYDTYSNYWNTQFTSYHPHAHQHIYVDVSWSNHRHNSYSNKSSGYVASGSKSNNNYSGNRGSYGSNSSSGAYVKKPSSGYVANGSKSNNSYGENRGSSGYVANGSKSNNYNKNGGSYNSNGSKFSAGSKSSGSYTTSTPKKFSSGNNYNGKRGSYSSNSVKAPSGYAPNNAKKVQSGNGYTEKGRSYTSNGPKVYSNGSKASGASKSSGYSASGSKGYSGTKSPDVKSSGKRRHK